jgi:hypothetical protein
MLFLNPVCLGKCTGIAYVESTKMQVCHNKRIKRNRVFRGMAETGKSTAGRFSGFNLHPICNEKGELLNFCLAEGSMDDRNANAFNVLSRKLSGKPDGGKGCISGHLQKYVFVKRSSIFVKKHSPNVILRTSSGISPFYSP